MERVADLLEEGSLEDKQGEVKSAPDEVKPDQSDFDVQPKVKAGMEQSPSITSEQSMFGGRTEGTPVSRVGAAQPQSTKTSITWQDAGHSGISHTPTGGKKEDAKPGPLDDSVFTTQLDEEALDAAKERQQTHKTLTDTEQRDSNRDMPTMSDVLTAKAQEHYRKAMQYQSEHQYELTITCLNKALNLNPKELSYYIQRAEAFLQLCDFESAILNYKRVCVLSPDGVHHYSRLALIYYLYGQCLFDQKLFPEALEAFSRAAEMRPEVMAYHIRSIACLAALQRHGECLALVNQKLETEYSSADLYVMRARLHQLFRNTTLCYYDVKDALAIDTGHSQAQQLMSVLVERAQQLRQQAAQLSLLGRQRDALQKISIAIETNPSVADFHVLRGALHRHLGDFNAAIDDYLLALDKTDHNEESTTYQESQRQLLLTYNDFAVECFTKAYYDEAILLLNKAIKGEKREKGLYINRGDCFFKEGSLEFALADYHQALELSGSESAILSRIAIIHNEYGVAEYQDRNYQEAESQFTLAIEHNPPVGQYYVSRAKCRQMIENLPAARQDVLLALHLDPTNQEIVGLLARLFPGKTVRDVLASPAAAQAKISVANLVRTTSSRPQPFSSKTSRVDMLNESAGQFSSSSETTADSSDCLPPVAGSLWKPGGCFPDLRLCMEEKQFHVKITQEKRKINNRVKDALLNRRSLRYTGNHLQEMPDPGTLAAKSNRTATQGLAVNTSHSTGWKMFNLGVGVKHK